MSDLCVLAVSLLAQSQQLEREKAAPPVSQPASVTEADTRQENCSSTSPSSISHTEMDEPEFSPQPSALSPQPSALSPQPSNTETLTALESSSQTSTRPIHIRPDVSPETIPSWQELLAPNPNTVLPMPTVPNPPTQIALRSPRPSSGSQLYQQRLTALRAGRTFTRLPANSYWETWVHATQQPTYEQWVGLLRQEAGSMARGQGSNRLTVLVGDSLSMWYPSEQLTSDRFWLNQGISGDTTAGVLRRLSAFANTHPDTIHVMVGINDLRRGATDTEVLNNLRQIMRHLRQTHPQAHIFVHSILPTRLPTIPGSRISQLNRNLANIAKQEQVSYLNLLDYFADAQGNLRRDLTTDGLHLNPRGYAQWQMAIGYRG